MSTIVYYNSDVKCESCKASNKVSSLIKLKDRYCCPKCFNTLKVEVKKQNKKR